MTGGLRSERGAVSTELAVLTPLLIGIMLFAVYAGRVAQAEGRVVHAAQEAARVASLMRDAAGAADAASATAGANLVAGGVACERLDVVTDTHAFRPGGHVAVTVRCSVPFGDLAMLAVPGSRQFASTAVEIIDLHRADDREPSP